MPGRADPCAVALLDALSRFTFERHGEGALHLVAGGLVVMAFFMAFLVLASLRPVRLDRDEKRRSVLTTIRPRAVQDDDPKRYALDAAVDPVGCWEKGRVAGRKVRARVLDDVMERMYAGGLGDPRIVHSAANIKVVRVHDCRGCEVRAPATKPACHFERGFLEASFGRMVEHDARVQETRCRAVGDPWCEFEVRYG